MPSIWPSGGSVSGTLNEGVVPCVESVEDVFPSVEGVDAPVDGLVAPLEGVPFPVEGVLVPLEGVDVAEPEEGAFCVVEDPPESL